MHGLEDIIRMNNAVEGRQRRNVPLAPHVAQEHKDAATDIHKRYMRGEITYAEAIEEAGEIKAIYC